MVVLLLDIVEAKVTRARSKKQTPFRVVLTSAKFTPPLHLTSFSEAQRDVAGLAAAKLAVGGEDGPQRVLQHPARGIQLMELCGSQHHMGHGEMFEHGGQALEICDSMGNDSE